MVIVMTYKNSKDMIFKELGCLQEKVLFYLAQNPGKHKQAIQQGIQHPSDQYGSIYNAVDTLEKLGFIESTEGISQKKVKIRIYSCTDSGVFYALTHSTPNIVKVLDAYKSKVEFCNSFRQLYDVWGQDHFSTYLKDVGKFLPIVQRDGTEVAMPYLLMLLLQEMKNIDPKDRKRNAKEALKVFPESKIWLKEWKKNLDELT